MLDYANQIQVFRVTAPEELLKRLRGLSTKELVSVAARFCLGDGPRDVPTATRFALRSVARRHEGWRARCAGAGAAGYWALAEHRIAKTRTQSRRCGGKREGMER